MIFVENNGFFFYIEKKNAFILNIDKDVKSHGQIRESNEGMCLSD